MYILHAKNKKISKYVELLEITASKVKYSLSLNFIRCSSFQCLYTQYVSMPTCARKVILTCISNKLILFLIVMHFIDNKLNFDLTFGIVIACFRDEYCKHY